MNAIFTVIFISSLIALVFVAPAELLPTLLGGAESAAKMALTLFCIYAVWLGLSRLAETSGFTKNAAKLLKPLTKKVFKTENDAACESLAMNVSCNLLGIGGAATPFAVKAIGELEKDNNDYAQKLLFVINATSIQILPTTVIALRASAGSVAAFDIFLPSLICTAISTLLGVGLFLAFEKLKFKKKTPQKARFGAVKLSFKRGERK